MTEEHYDLNDQNKVTPVVKTSDWAQGGMAISAGAAVSIITNAATQSLSAMKQEVASFANGAAKDLTDTKVDGVDAFSYKMSYEGERYYTVFVHGGQAYNIQYQYVHDTDSNAHADGYNTIVSTFTFK